jgi:hypothetical protein
MLVFFFHDHNPLRTSTARTALTTVWNSHAHAMAIKADPSYPAFIQDRDALATELVFEAHASFSGNPQRPLEAPVVEVDYCKLNPDVRPLAETHEMIWRLPPLMESMQGFIASSAGITMEDETWCVYFCGWRSVEVRFVCFTPHSPRGPCISDR